jgi:hypothetical protein
MSSAAYPKAIDDSVLEFPSIKFNVKEFGCVHDAKELQDIWAQLENKSFPLNKLLISNQGSEYIIHTVRLIDAICSCEPINGIEQRNLKLKNRLSVNLNERNYAKLMEALVTTTDDVNELGNASISEPKLVEVSEKK